MPIITDAFIFCKYIILVHIMKNILMECKILFLKTDHEGSISISIISPPPHPILKYATVNSDIKRKIKPINCKSIGE